MNWQYVAVYIVLGLTVVLILLYGIRKYKKVKRGESLCDGCASSDCALKEVHRKRIQQDGRQSGSCEK